MNDPGHWSNSSVVIRQGRQYLVLTNSQVFDEQIVLNKGWQQIGRVVKLLGPRRGRNVFRAGGQNGRCRWMKSFPRS